MYHPYFILFYLIIIILLFLLLLLDSIVPFFSFWHTTAFYNNKLTGNPAI